MKKYIVKAFKQGKEAGYWSFSDEYYAKRTKEDKEKEGYLVTIEEKEE